jgi:D-inositol-3-phosphate glycosyltransferase
MKHLVARSASELDSEERIEAEFQLIREADIVTTPSSSDRQYLNYLYGANEKKMIEVPPGVNTELFYPLDKIKTKEKIGINPHEKIILFVGRIEPLKGIDAILYALKILHVKKPDVPLRLLIVGGDISQHIKQWSPQLKQLESLRRILKISEMVDFVGQQPQNKLRDYYNAAEIVVMPSHYESFGMAAAEAMACGVPVITTNVTGISDLIDDRHSTLITTVNNPLLLAEQMEKLLTDPILYDQIRNSLMANITELRWEAIAKKVDTIYTDLIHNKEQQSHN